MEDKKKRETVKVDKERLVEGIGFALEWGNEAGVRARNNKGDAPQLVSDLMIASFWLGFAACARAVMEDPDQMMNITPAEILDEYGEAIFGKGSGIHMDAKKRREDDGSESV